VSFALQHVNKLYTARRTFELSLRTRNVSTCKVGVPNQMSTGPVPTRLVLLANLVDCQPRDKVRFLGWYVLYMPCYTRLQVLMYHSVDSYDVRSGILALKHPQPSSTIEIIADVAVDLVLETIGRENMEVGAWVNVMGYVREKSSHAAQSNSKRPSRNAEQDLVKHIGVQAIAVWSAGNLDLVAYEDAVRQRQLVGA